ncbi:MAG: STAS domain-containing protein [Thermoleophilia bacterium]
MALAVSIQRLGDITVVGVDGELDIYTAPEFREEVGDLGETEDRLIVDLTDARLVDSTGLSALVSLRNRIGERDGRMGLVCPNPSLRRLFEVTGMDAVFAMGDHVNQVRDALLADPAPGSD